MGWQHIQNVRIENGEVIEEYNVVVKGNRYGKDGEFGDKLDSYKYEGFVEPQEMIDEARAKAKQALENYYKKLAERSKQNETI